MLGLLALALLQTAPAPAGPPAWTFKETTDANGKQSATAVIRAADDSGRLIVRCDTVVVPIISVQYIPKPPLEASDSSLNVTVTYDEAQADISSWDAPGKGAYSGDPYDVFGLASKIAAAKKIRVDLFKPDGTPVESIFVGPGSDAMFRQVYGVCGLPYQAPPSFEPK